MAWEGDAMAFGLDNLPYGSVVGADGRRVAAVRLGDAVADLAAVDPDLFAAGTLDAFMAAGPDEWARVRAATGEALTAGRLPLVPLTEVVPTLAFTVADYVDFYTSQQHAINAGRIFRPGAEALPPSWAHQPIGYHGRSGSVVVSGTDVRRPCGHVALEDGVHFAPSRTLDFEAEVGFVVGRPGRDVSVAAADEHVFGVCLLNDWSARDIQGFETVPLGPFLGKSFATSVSAWITPLAALAGARVPPARPDEPAAHLRETDPPHGLDLTLRASINDTVVSRPPFATQSWSYAQLLAHLTSNGSGVRTGDLYASGTVSGPGREGWGSLLELTWNGTQRLPQTGRTWLADGDVVTISAQTRTGISLGEVRGLVLPARHETASAGRNE